MDASDAKGWKAAAQFAATRRALVTTDDLRRFEIRKGAIEKAVASGRLVRVHLGVFSIGHPPLDRPAEWLAAVLACGEHTLLGHRPAGVLWRIRQGEFRAVEVVNPTGRGRTRPGILVHQSPLEPLDVAVCDGIPVTSVARTIADLAHVVDPDDLVRTVREAQYRKLFHLASVELANQRWPTVALTRLLEDLQPAESWLEDAFLADVVARHRLPAPACQAVVEGFRVDFLWADARLVVEVDGGQHADPLRRQADRVRDNALHLAGFLVLRYGAADVRRRHASAAAQIGRALRR